MSGQLSIHRAFGLLVSIFLIAAPRTAFAHAHLVKSVPAVGATITVVPHAIQLWFSEAPEAALTVITVAGADGRTIRLGKVTALSLIHISEPTRQAENSYAVFCL